MDAKRGIGLVTGVLALLASAIAGCSSTATPSGPSPSFTAIHPWAGGADADCTVGASSTSVGCDTAFPITGDPYACPGFNDAGNGSSAACEVVCRSALVCSLSGLSDGTNAVDCAANCGSPEH